MHQKTNKKVYKLKIILYNQCVFICFLVYIYIPENKYTFFIN